MFNSESRSRLSFRLQNCHFTLRKIQYLCGSLIFRIIIPVLLTCCLHLGNSFLIFQYSNLSYIGRGQMCCVFTRLKYQSVTNSPTLVSDASLAQVKPPRNNELVYDHSRLCMKLLVCDRVFSITQLYVRYCILENVFYISCSPSSEIFT